MAAEANAASEPPVAAAERRPWAGPLGAGAAGLAERQVPGAAEAQRKVSAPHRASSDAAARPGLRLRLRPEPEPGWLVPGLKVPAGLAVPAAVALAGLPRP